MSLSNDYLNFTEYSLWLPKALYIIVTMAGSGWGRFQTIYFNNKGLSPSNIGILRGVGLVTKSMSYPMWGFLADWTGSLKLALVSTILASTGALGLFQYDWIFSSLWILIFVQMLRSSSNAVWPLVDTYAIASVKRSENKESYGHQRLWCAISWGLSSIIIGILIDQTDLSSIFYFTYFMVFLELTVVIIFMSSGITPSTDEIPIKTNSMLWNSLSSILEKRFFILFVMIFFYGVVMSITETVIFLYMDNELGSTSTDMGLFLGLSVLLEIPIFYYSQQLVSKYSANNLLIVAQITAFVRLLAYLFVTKNTIWMVQLIQISHGVCFAGFWVAIVHIGQEMAPVGLGSTVHTLISALYATLGHGCGGIIWGYIYEQNGMAIVFLGGAMLSLGVVFLTTLLPKFEATVSKLEIEELFEV